MTLQEAIQHAEEVAQSCALNNPKCAQDHLTLANWLKELQQLKQQAEQK